MRNFIVMISLVLSFSFTVSAQDDKKAVREVIDRLFTSMNLGDSAMLRSVFSKEVSMATVFRNKAGDPILIREGSINDFANAVGTPHPDPWSEPIWNVDIKIDADFAQAWCEYAFYIGKNYSHCGVDAFQLHKTKEGWKIFHLADTRRKEGCVIPKEVEARFK